MKNFIKPLVVMLSIILVCGGLLAVLSDLLEVTDLERIQRAIDNIYQDEQIKLAETVGIETIDMSDLKDKGEVKACYILTNGDYLILSRGKKGYSNGTITTYVAISEDFVVKKVVQDSYTGQTLMSKLTSIYEKYVNKNSATTYEEFSDVVITGATYSSHACSNSVYVALKFAQRLGGQQ